MRNAITIDIGDENDSALGIDGTSNVRLDTAEIVDDGAFAAGRAQVWRV